MPSNTYVLIASSTVGAGGASSIDFTSIPSTYTDLVVKYSLRVTSSTNIWDDLTVKVNGSTTSYTGKSLYGGQYTGSGSTTTPYLGDSEGSPATASTFGNGEIYIPNYSGSNNKSFSSDSVTENNGTNALARLACMLWSNTSAITSISLSGSTNFVQYSTAYLYGVKNS